MDRPISLVGKPVGGSYICARWELRVTARCLTEDLNAAVDSDFEAIEGLEIIKALVAERTDHSNSTRQITPLDPNYEAWVISRGHDHRGATVYDEAEGVIWLVAYGRHRSGDEGDFYPYCKELGAQKNLLPTTADYERMFTDRNRRFAEAVLVEAPLILHRARQTPGEHRCSVGGSLAAGISIEIEGEIDATAMTVAFFADQLGTYSQGILLLAALYPGDWEPVKRMPARELDSGEVAFMVMLESGRQV